MLPNYRQAFRRAFDALEAAQNEMEAGKDGRGLYEILLTDADDSRNSGRSLEGDLLTAVAIEIDRQTHERSRPCRIG